MPRTRPRSMVMAVVAAVGLIAVAMPPQLSTAQSGWSDRADLLRYAERVGIIIGLKIMLIFEQMSFGRFRQASNKIF